MFECLNYEGVVVGTSAYPDSSAALGCICSGVCEGLTSSQSARIHKSSIGYIHLPAFSLTYLIHSLLLPYSLLVLLIHLLMDSPTY